MKTLPEGENLSLDPVKFAVDVVTICLQSKAQVSGKNEDFPTGFTKYEGSTIIFNRANVASLSLMKSPPLF